MNRCFLTIILVLCIGNGYALSYQVKDNDIVINDNSTTYYYTKFCSHGSALVKFDSSSPWKDIFYISFEPLASATNRCGCTAVFQFKNREISLMSSMKELDFYNKGKFNSTDTSRIRWLVIHENQVIPENGENFQEANGNIVFFNEKNDTIILRKNGAGYIPLNFPYDCFRILVLFEDGTLIGEISGADVNTHTVTFGKSLSTISFSSIYKINNTAKWNDIGYYLEQGRAYKMAVEILEKVVDKAPDRVVAWLNLADAYW